MLSLLGGTAVLICVILYKFILGLIQLRNEFAYYMRRTLTLDLLGTLPEPINNSRTCEKCDHLLTCSAYQSYVAQSVYIYIIGL